MKQTQVFGYIDLGLTTQNLSMEEIKSRVDAWKAMSVDGLFLDDFGYDFGVSRSRQNEAVKYIHESGLRVIANAWDPDDAFGLEIDAAFNPDGAAPVLSAADFYFSESYQIKQGEYDDPASWKSKAEKLRDYQKDYNFHVLSTTTAGASDEYDESLFHYAWYSALLDGHEAIGWGQHSYSSDDALAPFYERPDVEPGGWFLSDVEWVDDTASRQTDKGQIVINSASFEYDFVAGLTSVARLENEKPDGFSLRQNYPNPFNPTTTIEYTIEQYDHVKVTIYDLRGRELMRLVDEPQQPGVYQIHFNAATWPTGLYFYRLSTGSVSAVKRMMLIK